jgi:hypothetical protein
VLDQLVVQAHQVKVMLVELVDQVLVEVAVDLEVLEDLHLILVVMLVALAV